MSILMIIDPVVPISQYYSVGATNAACQLCKSLSNMGVDITLAGNWDSDDCEMMKYVHPFNIYSGGRFYMKDAFKIINDHLNTNTYESINIHISTPSVAKYLVDLDTHDTPTYFTLHSWTGTTAVAYYYKNEYTQLVNSGKIKFVFLCESQMTTLFDNLGMTPSNYIIEPNAIMGEKYNITDEECDTIVNSMLPASFIKEGYCISVSRLVKSKHPYEVIASAILGGHNLVLVGKKWINDQDYADNVIDLINNNPGKVIWINEIPNHELLCLIKRAYATILYTDIEVCNLTIIESCIVGTPVVVGPGYTGVRNSIDNLSPGGVEEIVFPKRTPYGKKLQIISDCIDRAKLYRYDVSKFPDCYKWETHIDRVYKLVTNQLEF